MDLIIKIASLEFDVVVTCDTIERFSFYYLSSFFIIFVFIYLLITSSFYELRTIFYEYS